MRTRIVAQTDAGDTPGHTLGMETRGHGPRPINIGRRDGQRPVIRYRRADLIEFIGASHD